MMGVNFDLVTGNCIAVRITLFVFNNFHVIVKSENVNTE